MLLFDASYVREKINKALRERLRRAVLALGLVHPCAYGHDWESVGGRTCPRRFDAADGGGRCSQTVYRCRRCPDWDYGEPGGPAHRECYIDGPCDPSCVEEPEIFDDIRRASTITDGAGIPTSSATGLEHRQERRAAPP